MNRFYLPTLAAAALITAGSAAHAQALTQTAPPIHMAALTLPDAPVPAFITALPDAPSPHLSSSLDDASSSSLDGAFLGQAGSPRPGVPDTPIAPKYAGIILPGQKAQPLNGGEKVALGFRDAFGLYSLVSITISAGWSQLIDSSPHYGTNAEAFGKREGASALRSTVQTLGTEAVFAPLFHDDPRYYELGRGHNVVSRAVYAASRVVITRSDSGHNRINAPLLLGYGASAGVNNLIYPDRDTGASQSFQNWGTSLAGAALGLEVSEFLDDALRITHLRRR